MRMGEVSIINVNAYEPVSWLSFTAQVEFGIVGAHNTTKEDPTDLETDTKDRCRLHDTALP